jgi:hypothetical protein
MAAILVTVVRQITTTTRLYTCLLPQLPEGMEIVSEGPNFVTRSQSPSQEKLLFRYSFRLDANDSLLREQKWRRRVRCESNHTNGPFRQVVGTAEDLVDTVSGRTGGPVTGELR